MEKAPNPNRTVPNLDRRKNKGDQDNMEILKGKRTYIVAVVWGLAVALQTVGVIDASQLDGIQAVLIPLGLATLRAGVGK